MPYSTVVSGTAITASWSNTNNRDQVVTPFTDTSARASAITAPVDGMLSTLTTTDRLDIYNGSSWSAVVAPSNGALTSFSPTITQSGSVTFTNNYSSYIRTGRWIQGSCKFTVTGSGTASNTIVIGSLPATAAAGIEVVGTGYVYDTSVPTFWEATAYLASTTTFQFYGAPASTAIASHIFGSGASVMTAGLAVGDVISFSFQYEAATDA